MIRPSSRLGAAVLGFVGLALLVGCGGEKRPPVVATTAPSDAQDAGSRPGYDGPAAEPIEMGPDVRSVGDDGLGSQGLDYPMAPGPDGSPLADVLFGFDEASLTDEARATLERHALWLQTNRNVQVTIEGHCDERGTVEYNLALGDLRAQAARDYLVSLGVAPDRLSAVSYGKERPLDLGHDEAAWARNRRAHFVVR